ncbi:hypothetical protein ARMSODRAFT_51119 [Armillaria solidipes]|uniref:Uncharacterized protein n=1 Tax=Armillaria solidipes TaxID=1076256 RepID=A0A2H3C6K2_9AGAR|nr:hypothetical protein ARMSODRAFT_51119 [Armillaria solidipes]
MVSFSPPPFRRDLFFFIFRPWTNYLPQYRCRLSLGPGQHTFVWILASQREATSGDDGKQWLVLSPRRSSLALSDITTLSLKATSLGIKQADVVSFKNTTRRCVEQATISQHSDSVNAVQASANNATYP